MRIFLVGNYTSGTGPANVTYEYLKRLPENTLCQKAESKLARVPEILIKTMLCDVVLCSGYSGQNIVAIKAAHFLNKKVAYMMHGCVEHENAINGVPDVAMNDIERRTLEGADLILAVSENFENWLKENYPEFAGKISHVTNGIAINKSIKSYVRDKNMIYSVGGGMPRKQIKIIAEGIKLLNQRRKDMNQSELTLLVSGAEGLDSESVNSYDFVNNLGLVSKERVQELFGTCALFIQNSCFETFGLAPVEALSEGASVLLSKEVGALEIMSNTEECDIIADNRNPIEIAEKIEYLLDNPNADRIYNGIDKELTSWEARTEQLKEKLMRLI